MSGELTAGSPLKKILSFCAPLLVGNLFQQLYTTVDSIIVGQHLGMDAFAAIGSTSSLHALVIGFSIGLCSGLSIPVAQHYGAGNIRALRRAEVNGLYIAAIAAVLISILMTLFTRPILMLLRTPANILDDAAAFIGTLFAGSSALILFNMVLGYMRALGDSKGPLFYLILASVFNILLDLLFVMVLPFGVRGAALATILAQLCAALLGIRSIRKNLPVLHIRKKDLRLSLPDVGKLSAIALPIGLQCAITAVGSIILQMVINGLGSQAVAAISAGGKVHTLLFAPMDALGIAVMIFVCQNYGAGQLNRVRRGVSQVMLASTAYVLFSMLFTWFAGRGFAQFYLSAHASEILDMTQTYLRISSFFLLFLNMISIYRNALQGLGYVKIAMGSGVCELVARSGVSILATGAAGFVGVCFATPVAWLAAALFVFSMYLFALRRLEKKAATARQNALPNDENNFALPVAAAEALSQSAEQGKAEP